MLQHISALTNIPWWLSQNGACPGVVVYKKPLQLAYPLPLKFDHKYNVTGPGRQGTFLCIERRYPQGRNSKKREPVQQNVDLPLVLPKQKKKPYPIPLKKIQQAAKADKKLAEFGIEKKLEPPKNGLLVPSLVPAAYELLDDWKLLIKGLAQLLHYVPAPSLSSSLFHTKEMHTKIHLPPCILLLLLFSLPSFNVVVGGDGESGNPFTPKGYLIRYWKKQISNDLPKPWFLLNKASPLNAAQYATYTKLVADQNALTTQLHTFCSSANLMCAPDLSPSLEKHSGDIHFATYSDKNFTNYGTNEPGIGVNTFKNYSEGENIPVNSFRRYGRGSPRDNKFDNYASDGNVIDQSFNSYSTSTAGGSGKFTNYAANANDPNLHFTSYSDQGTGGVQKFTIYSQEANAGDQYFKSYGKNGNGANGEFVSYGNDTNVIGSTFTNYGQTANGGDQKFTSYGFNGNVPENHFTNYGAGGNGPSETFNSYRDQSNVGDDTFTTYVKDANGGEANFTNYGQSFNEGTDVFTTYGKGGNDPHINFKTYGVNNTFKDYVKDTATFSNYHNKTSQVLASLMEVNGGKKVNNRWVEPGKFFREKMLKSGTIMPMPDIKDKMPKRSFLPRVIASKLPFSTSKIAELKKIFHAGDESQVEKMIGDALSECERAPSAGETKRCVNSAEDMIDFATSVLGRNVVVRTTEDTKGSNGNIMIGSVKGINGGKVTKSVSCHQTLYPYLLYYCHSVPKVRVYEADILDPNSKVKINHGVAICHVDTSSWGPSHGAFVALGSGPGKIEVCHWIFENDMTWAIAD